MSETSSLLLASASRIFDDHCTRAVFEAAEAGAWPESLWIALDETGLTSASTSEDRGGPGVSDDELLALVRALGNHAVPVPLVETLFAEQVLAAAGLPALPGPLTIGPVLTSDSLTLARGEHGWKVSGKLHRIPWARHSRALVAIARYQGEERTVVIPAGFSVTLGRNFAGEPRDAVHLQDFQIDSDAVSAPGGGYSSKRLYFVGALYRAMQMAGALENVLKLSVEYANNRVQFGKTIGSFQAVQQQIALLACHVAAAVTASNAAAEFGVTDARQFQIAAAKARVGEAATLAASVAHQVHGAMGFTREHELHRSTRRLWSWREEFGNELEWMVWVGQLVSRVGGADFWNFMTSRDQFEPGKQRPSGFDPL